MKNFINIGKMRSLLNKESVEKISDFEKCFIQEGVKGILIDNHVNDSMITFLTEMGILETNSKINHFNKSNSLKSQLNQEVIYKMEWDYRGHINNIDFFGTQKDWNSTITEKIDRVSAKIAKQNKKGGANLVIINPEIESIITNCWNFLDDYKEYDGYCLLGILRNKYEVISSTEIDVNTIIVGRGEIGNTNLIESFGIINILNFD